MKDKHKTIVLVEHKIDLIAEYADEVIAFKDGTIIAKGKTDEVLSDVSLLGKGVNIPQVAVLGSRLKQQGLNIEKIPVTDKEAVKVIEKALREAK